MTGPVIDEDAEKPAHEWTGFDIAHAPSWGMADGKPCLILLAGLIDHALRARSVLPVDRGYRQALSDLVSVCEMQGIDAGRSLAVYTAMIDGGQAQALLALDAARRNARSILSAQSSPESVANGKTEAENSREVWAERDAHARETSPPSRESSEPTTPKSEQIERGAR